MCKKIRVLLIGCFFFNMVNGQFLKKWTEKPKYEGGVEMTTSLSIRPESNSVFAIETFHGILIYNAFFIGGGIGLRSFDCKLRVTDCFGITTSDFTLPSLHQYNFSIFLQSEMRFNNIKKLRKHLLPFISLKGIFLLHHKTKKWMETRIGKHKIYTNAMGYYPDNLAELSLGGELIKKGFPRLYLALGFSLGLFSLKDWGSYKNNDTDEEISYSYKIKDRPTLNLKLGIKL